MRIPTSLKILFLTVLAVLLVPTYLSPTGTNTHGPIMASYNPTAAGNYKAPLSSMGLLAVTGSNPVNIGNFSANSGFAPQTNSQSNSQLNNLPNEKTIQQNTLRFIIDNSYFPQTETTVAVDPNNPSHVVGGFNDQRYFYCPFLPSDCSSGFAASISGFTTSTDGGVTVAKSGSIPDVRANGQTMTTWGDPSVAASIDGNFYFASIAINAGFSLFGNGIMVAKSNNNLWDPNVSCSTPLQPITNRTFNQCWTTHFVNGTDVFPAFNFEDKDRIAVDRDASSPYYGSVYIGWDHFYPGGFSSSYLARCDSNLVSCVMISPSTNGPVSADDPFVAWTTPVVDKNGNVYVTWCNFGTSTTIGPVDCKISGSPPGGTSFGSPVEILSYMGAGTMMPQYTVVLGWGTEQFRTAPGIISIAADTSAKSNNLYFTTLVCISGQYYKFSWLNARVQQDNPGNCGNSAILLSTSSNGGATWTSPATVSNPAVNDQPFVTVDPQTGTVYVVYYTTQYDTFNHRIDVVASISNNAGKTFRQQRITTVSDEPDSDPGMYDYIALSGFGGSFSVPQFGDYFEATARAGTLYVLFTSNYTVEAGIHQADPFLAVANGNNQNNRPTSMA